MIPTNDALPISEDDTPRPWMKFAGAMQHMHQENLRIDSIIEEEFGQLEPEDLL